MAADAQVQYAFTVAELVAISDTFFVVFILGWHATEDSEMSSINDVEASR